jgi:DNA-binding MarR family transcriptional regulator
MEPTEAGRSRYPSEDGGAQRDVADELIELSRAVQGIHAHVAERHGLTPIQAKLLFVLMIGPRIMGSLAATFGVEKAALTGLVDRAERRGLVKRSPVPGDRRALLVSLTDEGARAATAFYDDAHEELNGLLSPLAPHEREQFREMLARINNGRNER